MAVSTDYISGYLAGYSDKTAGKVSAYPPVQAPPPTPAPTTIVVKPTDDIRAILKALKGGETLQLVAGSTYSWPAPLNAAAQYMLVGNGASVTFPAASMQSGMNMCFQITHAGTTIFGINAVAAPGTNYVLFRVYADNVSLSGNHIGDGFCNAVLTDHGGTKCQFVHNIVGLTNSCSGFFSQDDLSCQYNTFAGSTGETTIRMDLIVSTDVNPNRLNFSNNIVRSVGGTNLKGVMEWRQAGTVCVCASNTFYDYVRIGQDGKTTTNASVGYIAVTNNTWPQLCKSVKPPQYLMIKNGTVYVSANIFYVDGSTQVATGSGYANITFSKNVRKLVASGVRPITSIVLADSTCKITDDNYPVTPFAA